MPDDPPVRRPRGGAIAGIVIGVLFVGVGAAAFFGGGGPIIGIIAAAGGLVTLAAAVFVLVRP